MYNVFRILSLFLNSSTSFDVNLLKRKFRGKKPWKKKFTGIFMSLMVAAGVMAGCGSTSTSGDGDKGGTIKIGANLELYGGVASYGQSLKKEFN